MSEKVITIKPGKINDYLHLLDLREFGMRRALSCFVAEFDDSICILDCGSSLIVKRIWRYLKKKSIPFSKIKYLITSHHHFDHVGGMWKLYDFIQKHNPSVKILTNKKTKLLLNDYEFHLARGKRTYGDFIGEMKAIKDEAFEIIKPCNIFSTHVNQLKFHKEFTINDEPVKLVIFNTPGHTPDHQSPAFIRKNEIDFIFFGEAVGTLYHSSKLLTTPTTMPIFFNYDEYITSFYNLKKLKSPLKCGFGHYGVVNGRNNVKKIMDEHESFMKEFRSKIIQYYEEKPETKYVCEKLMSFFDGRADVTGDEGSIFDNILLGVVYGMMMDLGYRTLEGNEAEILKKYEN